MPPWRRRSTRSAVVRAAGAAAFIGGSAAWIYLVSDLGSTTAAVVLGWTALLDYLVLFMVPAAILFGLGVSARQLTFWRRRSRLTESLPT